MITHNRGNDFLADLSSKYHDTQQHYRHPAPSSLPSESCAATTHQDPHRALRRHDTRHSAAHNTSKGNEPRHYEAPYISSHEPEAYTTEMPAAPPAGGLLYPPLYYEGSPDYSPADENWMAHNSWSWMHCPADGSYYHVDSGTYHYYDPSSGHFYESTDTSAATAAGVAIKPTISPVPAPVEEPSFDRIASTYFTDAYSGSGIPLPSRLVHPKAFDVYPAEPSPEASPEAIPQPDEDDEYFFIDFDKDIIFHTAQIMSNMKGKLEREDRHVSKERLPMDMVSDTQACCFYSAIFDGHGGAVCAEYCVNHLSNNLMCVFKHARNTILKKLIKREALSGQPATTVDLGLTYSTDIEALRRALDKGFQTTNQNYLAVAEKKGLNDGCTALAVLLYGPDEDGSMKLLTAHAGDCRAVLCRSGEAVRLTEDHKPNRKDERRRIEAVGGRVEEVKGVYRVIATVGKRIFGLSTARSIGDLHMKKPKPLVPAAPDLRVFTIDFYRDLFVVMGSDGIWDVITDQEACDIVSDYAEEKSSQKAAEALVAVANARGSVDDKTATVVFFAWRRDLLDMGATGEDELSSSHPEKS